MIAPIARVGLRPAVAVRPASRSAIGNKAAFSSSARRMNEAPKNIKAVLNRPEITPLFLFTGAIIGLAFFFGGRHLVKDKELQLDHHKISKLATDTNTLNYDAMAKVASDPDGKFTKASIEEERNRTERLKNLRDEKEEKAKEKV